VSGREFIECAVCGRRVRKVRVNQACCARASCRKKRNCELAKAGYAAKRRGERAAVSHSERRAFAPDVEDAPAPEESHVAAGARRVPGKPRRLSAIEWELLRADERLLSARARERKAELVRELTLGIGSQLASCC
jgi:hypothetical protein